MSGEELNTESPNKDDWAEEQSKIMDEYNMAQLAHALACGRCGDRMYNTPEAATCGDCGRMLCTKCAEHGLCWDHRQSNTEAVNDR